ncbi:MAG: putative Ig domain-containing protein [Bacteroidota bacterium]
MKSYLVIFTLVFLQIEPLAAQFSVFDKFNRDLATEGISLTDWEGYIANPAIEISIVPPPTASFPISLTLSANHSRLYFDMPSSAGASGPTKIIDFNNASPISVFLSIFPDRGDGDESYTLTLNSSLGNQSIPIFVEDQDPASPTYNFNLVLDYSQDFAYNFFLDPPKKAQVDQAALDWAYFLNDPGYDQVSANSEFTYIWDDDYLSGNFVLNTNAYTGFLLYPHGFQHSQNRSGGASANGSFQSINGTNTQLRRSGSYDASINGNYNTLGWNSSITDDQWYVATNLGNVPNDLYSVAMHEIGHALGFFTAYPVFQTYLNSGNISQTKIVNYQGANVPVDAFSHLATAGTPNVVDRLSKRGAFGSDYANDVPWGRWLITKLDLLVLESLGYELRPTSAFSEVAITNNSLLDGTLNQAYSDQVLALGGIKSYNFQIINGSLPPGLSINPFDGSISGTPSSGGNYNFEVEVTDYDGETDQQTYSIIINSAFPLELVEFSGSISPDCQSNIRFVTLNEQNVESILLESSTDRRLFSPHTSFQASNQPTAKVYHVNLVQSNSASTTYYRLKIIDQDGSYSHSKILALAPCSQEFSLRISPNPVKDFLNLNILDDLSEQISSKAIIWDLQGRSLLEYDIQQNVETIDLSQIASGVYILQVKSAYKNTYRKIRKY